MICEKETGSGDELGVEAVDPFDDRDRGVSSEGRTMRSSAVVVLLLAGPNCGSNLMSGVRMYVVLFQRESIGTFSLTT